MSGRVSVLQNDLFLSFGSCFAGWFLRGVNSVIPFTNIRNVLVPGLAEAILALQPGDLLPVPFKSKLGYHVVLLEEKREVPFPSYEEVNPKVLSELERLQTTEFLNDLQKDAKILKVSDSSVD